MKFDFKQMFLKSLKYGILFGLPMIVDQFIISYPAYAQLTIGTLLTMLANLLKVRYGLRIP